MICSRNGSVHAAFRSTYQSPACHSGAAATIRAVLPPCGLISITPGTFIFSRWMTAGPLALSSTSTALIGTMHVALAPDFGFGGRRVQVSVHDVQEISLAALDADDPDRYVVRSGKSLKAQSTLINFMSKLVGSFSSGWPVLGSMPP